jgi:hypothetical protein
MKCSVPVGKVRDYLLNADHPDGGPKSTFFTSHGFERADHTKLAEALVRHFEDNGPSESIDTPFGRKYSVHGRLRTPDGRQPMIRSVWIVLSEETVATFVTAVPR